MTDREKLFNLMTDCENPVWNRFFSNSEMLQLTDHLIANGVTVREWISVNDQLPQPGKRVIATDGEFAGEMYINSRGKWQRYNVNDHALMMALDILWWMPLPEPPKEE